MATKLQGQCFTWRIGAMINLSLPPAQTITQKGVTYSVPNVIVIVSVQQTGILVGKLGY